MHNYLPRIYHFIEELNINNINFLNKKIGIIYRNYKIKPSNKKLISLRNFCKLTNRKFFISNDFELAFKLKLDGVYIPSFNKRNYNKKYQNLHNFKIIGSAHNLKEIKIKEKQGASCIFLSPLFHVNKKNRYLDVIKFNLLSKLTSLPIVALGGISNKNIRKIKMTKSFGFASISFIKKGNKVPNLML